VREPSLSLHLVKSLHVGAVLISRVVELDEEIAKVLR
jgi:hypothetical protein